MLGTGEILVILCVILILFGGKKLPEFARHLGQGIREFKRACSGIDETEENIERPLEKMEQKETIVVEASRNDESNKS